MSCRLDRQKKRAGGPVEELALIEFVESLDAFFGALQ
jgi:hypothetical protein